MKDKHLGTMLVFAMVLVILFLVYRNTNFLYAALAFGAIGLLIPALSRLIHKGWMKFAEVLGSVMSRVILVLVFYLFLVPVAFLSRLFRKSPFQSRNPRVTSYFTERGFTYTAKSLEEVW